MSAVAITSGQQVLLPESTRKNRKERRITVAVNSRDRNTVALPNSNNFRWSFRRPLKDVVSIELVGGFVPADLYNVAVAWGSFRFGENGGATKWTVTLSPGQYTATQLAAELQTQLNALAGITNTYTVAYSDITKKITVSATGAVDFTFYFLTGEPYTDIVDGYTGAVTSINCPARLLGFGREDSTGASGGSLVAHYRADPDLFLKRLYLHLNADNSVDLHRVELGAGRRDCFHIITTDQIKDGYYTFNKDMYMPLYYSSPAPISRMTTLNISLRDEFYRPLDLSQHDYTLVFEITTIE